MTIDIACIGQTKASGSVCRIVKHIGSGLINGNHSGISGGVSLFLANIELQSFKFIFTHFSVLFSFCIIHLKFNFVFHRI